MKANLSFERYEAMRDLIDLSKSTQSLMSNPAKEYQTKWADRVQDVTYSAFKENFDCPAKDYRASFEWDFEAFDAYSLVSEEDATLVQPGLTDEFPRSGTRAMKDDNDRGEYEFYRIPEVEGELLPIMVTDEDELQEANELLDSFMQESGLNATQKAGNEDSPSSSSNNDATGPFTSVSGIGDTYAQNLQDDPRALWVTEERILSSLSDEEEERIEQLTDRADMDLLEAVSIDIDVDASPMSEDEMFDMIPEDKKNQAEILLDAGEEMSDVLDTFL